MSKKKTSTVELEDGREITFSHPGNWSEQRIKHWAKTNAPAPYTNRANDRTDDVSIADLLQAGFLDSIEPFVPDNFIYDAEDFQELESLKGPGLIQSKEYRDAAIALQAKKREEFIREAVGIPLDADLDTTDNIVRALGDPTSLIGVGKTGAKTLLGKTLGTFGQAAEVGLTTAASVTAAEQAANLTGVPVIDEIIQGTVGIAAGTATGLTTAPIRATTSAPIRAVEEGFALARSATEAETQESVIRKTNAVSQYLAEKQVQANLNNIARTKDPADIGAAVDKIAELKEFAPDLKLDGVIGALSDNAAVQDWTRKVAQRDAVFIEKLDQQTAENLKVLEKRLGEMTGMEGTVKDDALYNIAQKVYNKKRDQLDLSLEKAETAFEAKMAELTARLSSESLDVVGQKIKEVAAQRESALRSQADSLYEAAEIAAQGVTLPERHVKGLSTLAASLKIKDPFGVDSAVRQKLMSRWRPDEDGNIPEVPVNEIVSLKKAINTDLNKQYKAKFRGDFEAPQRIEQLSSLKTTVEGVIKSLKRSSGTQEFANALKKADGFYYEKIGLPLRADGMAYINQSKFNKDAANHLTNDTQKAREYINFVGPSEGVAVLRHAMRLKAESAVLDPNGQVSTQKLRNFLANRTNQELISMAKMGKEFSNLERSTKTLIKSRESHKNAHDAESNRIANGFFKALTEKNAGGAVRSMLQNPRLRKELMAEINSLSKRNRDVVLSGVRNAYITNGMVNTKAPMKEYLLKNKSATLDFFGPEYVSDLNKFGEIFDLVKTMDANVSKALGADPAFDALQQQLGINAAEVIGLARNQILSTQRKIINAGSKIFLEKGRQQYYKMSADMLKDPEVLKKLANPPEGAIAKTKVVAEALRLGKAAGGEVLKGTILPYYQRVLFDTGITGPSAVGPIRPSVGAIPALRGTVGAEVAQEQERMER